MNSFAPVPSLIFALALSFGQLTFGQPAFGQPAFGQPAFEAQTLDDDIAIGYGLAIGDVDGDDRPDILLADKKQFVWYRNGDWKRFVMIDSLTERDNVCIAARDLDGDGQVEVAVGAQWNPGETSDLTQSGSVHYLIRPKAPTQSWNAIALPHEPTVHRMRWVQLPNGRFQLIMLPLHGRGNQGGKGKGVRVLAYDFPKNPRKAKKWRTQVIDSSLHMTHNLAVIEHPGSPPTLLIAGREGIKTLTHRGGSWLASPALLGEAPGFGEVRQGNGKSGKLTVGIQPIHGNALMVFEPNDEPVTLTDDLAQGHALATADLLGLGMDQVVVGWRNPNDEQKVGIRLYVPEGNAWKASLIDDNGMACEDLKVADLNGDGKLDIIAAGRSTHNLKVYWNRN